MITVEEQVHIGLTEAVDVFDYIYDCINGTNGKEIFEYVADIYNDVVIDHPHLHPDDDFEQIICHVLDNLGAWHYCKSRV